MANPRKFSEKIALHTHRQAEETARFEQIMKEVSDATARQEETSCSHVPFRESRPRSQGGPIRRQDRKHDTSPYSSGSFLSPPSDTNWRRTNSDSALHQSTMQGTINDRNDTSNGRWLMQTMNGPEQHDNRRPRSSCEVPRVPGINIYHTTHEPGTLQIPIGNNTGSLPDLTSVHFPSPIHMPLDQDQGSSPYSSSPVNNSPSTLSPTNVPPGIRQQQGRFQFNTPVSSHQNHLSVPNSRYLQRFKCASVDNNCIDSQDFTQLRDVGIYQQQVPATSPSPTLQQVVGYRSPRPSPQSSPSLGGRHSAPCSPGAPSPLSPLTNDYMYNQHQTAQLQQHFEQISMMDTPVSSVSYMEQPGNVHLTQSQVQTLNDVAELTGDGGYYSTSPSQLVYHTAPPSVHTTPNTPTSIPDIILTDFSVADDLSRQDFTKQFEAELLANDSELREGLEPLDFDGLQMLSGINLIPDGVEDHFRLDRS